MNSAPWLYSAFLFAVGLVAIISGEAVGGSGLLFAVGAAFLSAGLVVLGLLLVLPGKSPTAPTTE